MAHKKAAGSTRLGRDSVAKRLGIKAYGDQPVKAGEVIVRQRGLPYHPGVNVRRAGDDTLYALASGLVHFRSRKVREFTGQLVNRRFVDVVTATSTSREHSRSGSAFSDHSSGVKEAQVSDKTQEKAE